MSGFVVRLKDIKSIEELYGFLFFYISFWPIQPQASGSKLFIDIMMIETFGLIIYIKWPS